MKLYGYEDTGTREVHFYTKPCAPNLLGTIEVTEPDAKPTATLTMAGMDDLIRAIAEMRSIAEEIKQVTKPPKPKQTVTKEAEIMSSHVTLASSSLFEFCVPNGAKNIKCTYEVEE